MQNILETKHKLSDICVNLCKGACCNPWWGIIFYTLKKEDGFSSLRDFKTQIADSIKNRADRIISQYITNEIPAKHLFKTPEKYNIKVNKIDYIDNHVLLVNLIAMFAFRCDFLTSNNRCSIHPAILGKDIRPPHCEELGTHNAKSGEKGYCRIIDAAVKSPEDFKVIESAVKLENEVSKKHYREGFDNIEEATRNVINQIEEHSQNKVSYINIDGTAKKHRRNDLCFCGSGIKHKKCHGK